MGLNGLATGASKLLAATRFRADCDGPSAPNSTALQRAQQAPAPPAKEERESRVLKALLDEYYLVNNIFWVMTVLPAWSL